MPKVKIELSPELVKAIQENLGGLSMSEFIEQGVTAYMSKGKVKLNKAGVLGSR